MFDAIKAYRDDSDLRDAVNVAQRTVSFDQYMLNGEALLISTKNIINLWGIGNV